jgi:Flp pilus assembly protein TadB
VRRNRPPLITDAEASQDDQLMSREIRYVIMMGIRALCLVVAAILVGIHAPYLVVWLPLLLLGMVVLPWLAVILANDRPPKAKYRLATRLHGRQTGSGEPESGRAITGTEGKIIDHDG